MGRTIDVSFCLPPDRTQHKVFFYIGVYKRGGQAQAKTHALVVYAGHKLTRYNVSQMTQLVLNSLGILHESGTYASS